MNLNNHLQQKNETKYLIIIFCFSIILFFGYSFQIIKQFKNVNTSSYDLSIYIQSLWKLNHKQNYNTIRKINIWAHHIQPSLYIFAKIYKLKKNPLTLLLLQLFWGIFSVFLIFYFLKKFLNNLQSFFISILFLLYPAYQNSLLFDFHPGTFAVPLVFILYYFIKKNNLFFSIVICFLIFSFRENFALTTAILSLFLFKQTKTSKIIFFISVIYFWLIIFYVKPYFHNNISDTHLKYYSQYGFSAMEILKNIFIKYKLTFNLIVNKKNLFYFLSLYSPLLFFPLILDWKKNILIIPLFLLNILSNHPGTSTILFHFQNEIIPLLFIIIIENIYNKNFSKKFFISFFIVLTLIQTPIYSTYFLFNSFSNKLLKPDEKSYFLKKVKTKINKNDSIATDIVFSPYFAYREKCYIFPNISKKTKWIILTKKFINKNNINFIKYLIQTKQYYIDSFYKNCLLLKISNKQ